VINEGYILFILEVVLFMNEIMMERVILKMLNPILVEDNYIPILRLRRKGY